MGSRTWITGLLIAGVALLVVPLAGGTSSVGAAPTDMTFVATLSGANETSPNASPGTGHVTVVLNGTEDMITLSGNFSMLTSNSTAAHIHGPAPQGTDAAVIFPLTYSPTNSTSGTFPSQMFAVTPTQATDLKTGLHYVNVHSVIFPGGEIRGQLLSPTAVRIIRASAIRTSRGVLVRWRTGAEVQTIGFNVYRQYRGTLVKSNRTLISSLFAPTSGHTYSWLDRAAPRGTVSYRIQAVNRDGSRAWLGAAVGVRAR